MNERFSQFLEKKGFSISSLARKAGVREEAIGNWKRGKSRPLRPAQFQNLKGIAGVLGITCDELLQMFDFEEQNND